MGFIAANLRVAQAITLIAPLAIATALINPIRDLDIITDSQLERFLAKRPELRHEKWLVLSNDTIAPAFVAAHGIDVFNAFHVVPDLSAFKKLDPQGTYLPVYNSSGFLVVQAEAPSSGVSFENLSQLYLMRMRLSPIDSRLHDIGIAVLAFREKPPAGWVEGLKPISPSPIDTLWLYEMP